MSTRNRVRWSRGKFYHIEDRMEAAHGVWQFKVVCVLGDLFFYHVGSQPSVGELPRWPGGADVGSVKINLVTWLVRWHRKLSLVIIPSHVVLSLIQG